MMDSTLALAWWELPTPRRFLDRLAAAVGDGQSAVVRLPRTICPHGALALREALRRAWGQAVPYWDLTPLPAPALAGALAQKAGWAFDGAVDPTAPLPVDAIPAGTVVVAGFEAADDRCRHGLAAVTRSLAALGQRPPGDRPVIVVMLTGPAAGQSPERFGDLAVFDWKGEFRLRDGLLFADRILEILAPPALADPDASLLRDVATATIAELAGDDADLAVTLAGLDPAELLEPEACTAALLAATSAPAADPATLKADQRWLAGLDQHLDHAVRRHSGWAARQSTQAVAQRLWRAQIRELMPLLEDCRDYAIRYFRHHLPGDTPGEQAELIDLLRFAESTPLVVKNSIVTQLQFLREVRNELAHFHPLGYETLSRPLLGRLASRWPYADPTTKPPLIPSPFR